MLHPWLHLLYHAGETLPNSWPNSSPPPDGIRQRCMHGGGRLWARCKGGSSGKALPLGSKYTHLEASLVDHLPELRRELHDGRQAAVLLGQLLLEMARRGEQERAHATKSGRKSPGAPPEIGWYFSRQCVYVVRRRQVM